MREDNWKIVDCLLYLTGLWFSLFLLYHLGIMWNGPMIIREDNKTILILEITALLITSTLYLVRTNAIFKALTGKKDLEAEG